jgi:Pin2-interacting protein X1
MGLAEPKKRQRIGADPRNKNWKEDDSAIGFKLLSKMGWSEGKGLGATLSGRQTNIKVSLKDDTFGIGADQRTSDNWLENSFGFDDILKRIDNDDGTTFTMSENSQEANPSEQDANISSRHLYTSTKI